MGGCEVGDSSGCVVLDGILRSMCGVCTIQVAYCLLLSPLLIVAFGFLGLTVGLIVKGGGERKIAGYTMSRDDQLKLCAGMTLPLLYMSGATGTLFWVVGATLLIVLGHAAVMPLGDDADTIIETI
jgi:hypothetical protein